MLDANRLLTIIEEVRANFDTIFAEAKRNIYDGITFDELALASILAVRTLIETEPNYSNISTQLLLDKLRAEALTYIAEQLLRFSA